MLFPRYMKLLSAFGAVCEIQIYQRLIGYAFVLRKGLEIVDRIGVDIDRYLLFQPLGVWVLTGIEIFDIIFISHFVHLPSQYILFSFLVASRADMIRITLS